jgi:hypothetical protein
MDCRELFVQLVVSLINWTFCGMNYVLESWRLRLLYASKKESAHTTENALLIVWFWGVRTQMSRFCAFNGGDFFQRLISSVFTLRKFLNLCILQTMAAPPNIGEQAPPPLPPPINSGMYGGPTSSYGMDPYASTFGGSNFMQPSFGSPYGLGGYNNYGGFGGGLYGNGMLVNF